jgi:hypoxanthine phosphoribosyltransferase
MTKEQMRAEIRLTSSYYKKTLADIHIIEDILDATRRRMQDAWHAYYQVADSTEWANMMAEMKKL